jgi:hypothetical protein
MIRRSYDGGLSVPLSRSCTQAVEVTQVAGYHKEMMYLEIGGGPNRMLTASVKSMTVSGNQLIFEATTYEFVLLRESPYRSESRSDFFVTISRKPAT